MAGERNSRGVDDAFVHGCCHQGRVASFNTERDALSQQFKNVSGVCRIQVAGLNRCRRSDVEYLYQARGMWLDFVRTGNRTHGDIQVKVGDTCREHVRIGECQQPRRQIFCRQHYADIGPDAGRLAGTQEYDRKL